MLAKSVHGTLTVYSTMATLSGEEPSNLFIAISLGLEQSRKKKEKVRPLMISLLRFPE